jgi:methionyl aminopeptidase
MKLEGMTTLELNDKVDDVIRAHNATPTFLYYRGFPKSCCISLNHEVVHGIPDNRIIVDGDIVKVDVGVTYQGYIADAAKTFTVGTVSSEVKNLLAVTKQALKNAIETAKIDGHISDISRVVQQTVESNGYGVVRELTGHGVGQDLHEDPMIPNFVSDGPDALIKSGMVFAIEPMVTMGHFGVITADNGWTIMTKDGSLSAHYEDTIAILEKGNINLTRVTEN